MQKLLCLLLSLIIVCSMLPASAEESDLSTIFPTAPMSIVEYITYHSETMRGISADYSGNLYLIPGNNGYYALTDGVGNNDVSLFEWRVRGDQIVGITVSFPIDPDDPETSTTAWYLWSIFAILPFAIRDGMTYDEAYTRCYSDVMALLRSSDNDTASVYGIQASISQDADINRTHYTIHGEGINPADYETPALGLPSFTDFKAAATSSLSAILPESPTWTTPVESNGNYVIGIKALRDNPLLMYQEDELLILVVTLPISEEDPQSTLGTVQSLSAHCMFYPLLMAHGMTQQEAAAAFDEWNIATRFIYALIGAMCGEPIEIDFYGMPVTVGMTTSNGQQHLLVYISSNTGE